MSDTPYGQGRVVPPPQTSVEVPLPHVNHPASGSNLPFTGGDVFGTLALGCGLLAAGLILRRRRVATR